METTIWANPPLGLMLTSGAVHVWRIELDQPELMRRRLAATLAVDEQARAARFHFDRDRHHFIVGRGVLRTILSRYCGVTPHSLQFSYGPQGKPALAAPEAAVGLRFNLSHSHGLALLAVTRGRELGVDIEYMRPLPDAESIAEHFFSLSERAALRAIPPEGKVAGFFTCWTRKEAYIKAIAKGLSQPLDQFDVSLTPGEPAALLAVRNRPEEVARWSLRNLTPGAEYAAAIVVEGADWELHTWHWRGVD